MSCATNAYAHPLALSAPPLAGGRVLAGIVLLVDAFREALEMRRVAFKDRVVFDE
jgi:hypothetical protein